MLDLSFSFFFFLFCRGKSKVWFAPFSPTHSIYLSSLCLDGRDGMGRLVGSSLNGILYMHGPPGTEELFRNVVVIVLLFVYITISGQFIMYVFVLLFQFVEPNSCRCY